MGLFTGPAPRITFRHPDAVDLVLTVYYRDETDTIVSIEREIIPNLLEEQPTEVVDMREQGFTILRDNESIFVPPHQIVSIKWRAK